MLLVFVPLFHTLHTHKFEVYRTQSYYWCILTQTLRVRKPPAGRPVRQTDTKCCVPTRRASSTLNPGAKARHIWLPARTECALCRGSRRFFYDHTTHTHNQPPKICISIYSVSGRRWTTDAAAAAAGKLRGRTRAECTRRGVVYLELVYYTT